MDGTYTVMMGDRGRLVVPAELRERLGLTAGTPVTILDTPGGVVMVTRTQLKKLVRASLAGPSMVDELLRERRADAAMDDSR